jgi:hypothetical protein
VWQNVLLSLFKGDVKTSALELYAKQVRTTKGTQHLAALDSLRRYIRLTPMDELIRYINMITDPDILRTLMEAGMRAEAWTAAVRRADMLRKEKEGGI